MFLFIRGYLNKNLCLINIIKQAIIPGFLRVSEEYQIPRGKKTPVPFPHDGPFLESDPPMQNAPVPDPTCWW